MPRFLIMLLLLATQAGAGAWPREKGDLFLSFSNTFQTGSNGGASDWMSLYAEYGLAERATIGLDFGGDGVRSTKTVGFLIMPVSRPDAVWKRSVELGFGEVDDRMAFRPGFSIGRGTKLLRRDGWIAVDTRWVMFQDGRGGSRVESDLTLGLSAGRRSKVIVQFQAGDPSNGAPYLRLAPSLVFERKAGRHIEIGMTAGIVESSDLGVKLGIWRRR